MRPDLKQLAIDCHRENEKWWRDPATGAWKDRDTGEMFMLTISEIAEAMEGLRKDLMDDHLPHRKMEEVELADAVIRIMDYCGFCEIDPTPKDTWPVLPNNNADVLRAICLHLAMAGDVSITKYWQAIHIRWVVAELEAYAARRGFDLYAAVEDKRAYNRTRYDHTPEARLAPGGKKF